MSNLARNSDVCTPKCLFGDHLDGRFRRIWFSFHHFRRRFRHCESCHRISTQQDTLPNLRIVVDFLNQNLQSRLPLNMATFPFRSSAPPLIGDSQTENGLNAEA